MKRLLIVAAMSSLAPNITAGMRFNPLNNLVYSHPETPEINQDEYRMLLNGCREIECRIIVRNNGQLPSKKIVLDQCDFYLKAVGTPTALRLMADLKANVVYFANGNFMRKIFA